MLGIDAPELHYSGANAANPAKCDAAMEAYYLVPEENRLWSYGAHLGRAQAMGFELL